MGAAGSGVCVGGVVTAVPEAEREEMLVLAKLNLPEAIAARWSPSQIEHIWFQTYQVAYPHPFEEQVLWEAMKIQILGETEHA